MAGRGKGQRLFVDNQCDKTLRVALRWNQGDGWKTPDWLAAPKRKVTQLPYDSYAEIKPGLKDVQVYAEDDSGQATISGKIRARFQGKEYAFSEALLGNTTGGYVVRLCLTW